MKKVFLLLLGFAGVSALCGNAIQNWTGYPGGASVAPTVTYPSCPGHESVVRVESTAPGIYQGAVVTFPSGVNLAECAGVEFEFRHNFTKRKFAVELRFFQKEGMFYGNAITPSDEWQKIFLPFDPSSFKAGTGNTVVFGSAESMRLTPTGGAMKNPGQFFEIADFRFVPKTETAGSHRLKVMSYTHRSEPTSGDPNKTALTDGDKTKNVFYRAYSEQPEIVFDFGGRFTFDEIRVDALAAPSHNFDTIEISGSYDGETWTPGGILKNTDSGIEPRLCVGVFKPQGKPLVGRYIRLTATRPRSDFEVRLSEVTFSGHAPTETEIAAAARANYDRGQPMPERNQQNYYELICGDWRLHVSRANGVVNGVYYNGKLLVERFASRYTLQSSEKDIEISGYDDVVTGVDRKDDSITLTITNPQLPGLTLERTWRVDGNALLENVVVINNSMKKRMFLRLATETIFERDFRSDGFYEMPGSALASGMFRIPAGEIQMDRALTNIPMLALENGKRRQTVWHNRWRFNDRFAYYDIGTEEDNLQVFRANGWLLTSATIVPADAPRQSFENRFSVTSGGMLKAYDEYLNLPDTAAFRAQIRRPAWLRDVRGMPFLGWDGAYPGSSRRLIENYRDIFGPRGYWVDGELIDMDGIWGDLPISGKVRGQWGNLQTAEHLKDKVAGLRKHAGNWKLGIYTWFWSAFPWSTPVKNHPEWFVSALRNGAPASWFPGVNVNYLRFWGIKESREEATRQIVNFVNYYQQDSWYLDGGKSGTYAKDWKNMRIDDPFGQTDFYLATRAGIQDGAPNRVVIFNHSENPIGDMGFLESFGGTLTNEWRRGAILMWKFKMYSYRDPLHHSVYCYWLPGVDGPFQNYMVGLGVNFTHNGREVNTRDVPFVSARYETRQAQLTDADVRPDWRFDVREELECMALRQQNNGWVFMQYHGKQPVDRQISVQTAPLGMNDPKKPLYVWIYTIRDARKYSGLFGVPQLTRAYQHSGWIGERAMKMEFLGTRPWNERFESTIAQEPGIAKVLMFSQIPAVVLSVDGEPSHYYLSGQPEVKISGDRERFVIDSEAKQAEIGILLQNDEVPAQATLNGTHATFTLRREHGTAFAVFQVGQGSSDIALTYQKTAPVKATALDAELEGRKLTVSVAPADAPVELYCDGRLVLSKIGSYSLELPDAVRDGEYELIAGSLSKKIKLEKLGRPLRVRPLLPVLPTARDIRPVERTVKEIPVLSQATCYSVGAGRSAVDADQLLLDAGTIEDYESHYNHASAALELRTKRYLKLRIHNDLIRHTRYGYQNQYHFIRRGHPGAFFGLMLDFGTPSGYTVRSAAGFGHQTEARKTKNQNRPDAWGTRRPPEHIYELNRALYDTENEVFDCVVDLASLGAPADWDGRLWLTLHGEHLCPDRGFRIEILETADKLPAGTTAVKPLQIGGDNPPQRYSVPIVKTAPDWGKVPVLANLPPTGGMRIKLDTLVQLADDTRNLYVRFDCRETAGRKLDTEGGRRGKPWEGDGVELFVQLSGDLQNTFHLIVDAAGASYMERAPFVPMPGKKQVILNDVPVRFTVTPTAPGWITEITIPWSVLGGRPSADRPLGFNLMRNRVSQGKYSFYTLSPDGTYFSKRQCLLQVEQ